MKIRTPTELRSTAEARRSQLLLPALILSAVLSVVTAFFVKVTHPWILPHINPHFRCAPDGSVHSNLLTVVQSRTWWALEDGKVYNPYWDPALFISITLGFGKFAFSTAKAIDICWDLVLGRGGQLLIVFLVYPTIRLAIMLAMEREPVDFPLFARTWFERMSLTTMGTFFHALRRGHDGAERPGIKTRLPRILRLAALVLCCAYAMIFPTIMSAMTGYQAELSPYIQVPPLDSGVLVNASQISFPPYVLQDGHRIGELDHMPTNQLSKDDEHTLLTCKQARVRLF